MDWTFLNRDFANYLNSEYNDITIIKDECVDLSNRILRKISNYKDTTEFESMFMELEYLEYTLQNLFDDYLQLIYIKHRLLTMNWVSDSILNKKGSILDRRIKLDSIKMNMDNG